jgi:hypothetical protein
MTLSPDQRRDLEWYASHAHPGVPAIHVLFGMYALYGDAEARVVTHLIARCTSSSEAVTDKHFGGFIVGSNTEGFRAELRDPRDANAQTGHFFTYVSWALNGISELEYAAAIGHELYPDCGTVESRAARDQVDGVFSGVRYLWNHDPDLNQVERGRPYVSELTTLVGDLIHGQAETMRSGANQALDYHAVDDGVRSFDGDGSAPRIEWEGARTTGRDRHYRLDPWQPTGDYTGNSIEDLRCTVAGFVFGRLIAQASIETSAAAARWLQRNVLAAGSITGLPANGRVRVPSQEPGFSRGPRPGRRDLD